jgi:ABC-type microcin C transport system duplicated ATPase subunit YejF
MQFIETLNFIMVASLDSRRAILSQLMAVHRANHTRLRWNMLLTTLDIGLLRNYSKYIYVMVTGTKFPENRQQSTIFGTEVMK